MKPAQSYSEQIYAGVLGKLLGVYLGRPVEGWTFQKIQQHFDEVFYYKNSYTGAPLIVPDDDISGTFAFYRALEDNGYAKDISAKQIGNTWLNYIIENKTILWWGGLSRSSEHTAFLRLKNGISAPESGSIKLNGRSMAEQIGAQIFIDTWAMVNPENPGAAAKMAREAASVSHDGIAVEAACYIAAMQAMAFEEKNLDVLLDKGLAFVKDENLKQLVADVRLQCAKATNWKEVRAWIEENHGYEKYPGNCPMVTNHLVVLMALLMAKDDFQKSISIATSAGWDTDCNAGNVGAFNGIRLGLAGINAGANLRGPVADRMYICTADGGSCITDAVAESRKILFAAATLRGESVQIPSQRFAFEYPGSTQGFIPYPNCVVEQALTCLKNENGEGLSIHYNHLAMGTKAMLSVDTFVENKPKGVEGTSYFEVVCSPTLYGTQTLKAEVFTLTENTPDLHFFIDYYGEDESLVTLHGEPFNLKKGVNLLEWQVPDVKGHAIYRLGICLKSEQRVDGSIVLRSLDWAGAPAAFEMPLSMEMTPSLTPWTTTTTWLQSFVSSAENFCPDYTTTFSISHPTANGVVTTGGQDWRNYAVQSRLTLAQQNGAGLVARAKGHRRYYAALLRGKQAVIVKQLDDEEIILAAASFDFEIDKCYTLRFILVEDKLCFFVDGKEIATATDEQYVAGGAGFIVDTGAMLAEKFRIERI